MDINGCVVESKPAKGYFAVEVSFGGTEDFDGEDGFVLRHATAFTRPDAAERLASKVREAGVIDPSLWVVISHGCCTPPFE